MFCVAFLCEAAQRFIFFISASDSSLFCKKFSRYDDVVLIERKDGKKGLYFVKRHNGVTYYLESINSNRSILQNKQMIKVPTGTIPNIKELKDAINKKWNIDSYPNDASIPRMYVQDVPNNVPTSNVPQTPPIVNGQNEKVTKNDVPIPIKEGKPTKKETPWTQAVQDIGKNFYFKDPARVFDAAAGGRNTPLRKEIREKIEEPWLKAKEETTKSMREITNEYREKTKEHNIKSGSKESAAVQWYGEGVRVDKHGNSQEYTLEDLKKEFPEDWENIVKHEKLCRKMYDDYLIRTNKSLEKVYPNVLEKAQADAEWHETEAQTLRENLNAILNVYKEETGLDVADLTNRDKISNPSATATIEKLRSYIRDKKAAYLNTLDLPAEQKRLLFAWFASSDKEQKKQRYNVVNNLSILQGDKNAVLQWLMGNKNISETQIKTIFNRK